jgi:hypothetical protein
MFLLARLPFLGMPRVHIDTGTQLKFPLLVHYISIPIATHSNPAISAPNFQRKYYSSNEERVKWLNECRYWLIRL